MGASALAIAAGQQDHDMIAALLMGGADPQWGGYDSRAPFELALEYADVRTLTMFVAALSR